MMQQRYSHITDELLRPVASFEMMVTQALRGLKPYAQLPDEQIDAIGGQCGTAEIEAAILWLDTLARDREAVEDWNRPALKEILRLQDLLYRILSCVPARHFASVAAGLESPEWRTRIHVALALDTLDRRAAEPYLRQALAREKDDQAGQVIVLALARAESESA